jgi:hypothetical protein
MAKMPLGLIGETKHILIDSTKALRSGASLSTAIEHTFDEFMESCINDIEEEKALKKKLPSFWEFNKTTAETIKQINSKNVDKRKPMHVDKPKRPQTASAKTLSSKE